MDGARGRRVVLAGLAGGRAATAARPFLQRGVRLVVVVAPRDVEAQRALAARGVEVALAAPDSGGELTEVTRGAAALVALGPPLRSGTAAAIRHGHAAIEAARTAAVGRFVYGSAAGADPASPTRLLSALGRVESAARALGLPLTVLRPSLLMEDLLEPPWRAGLARGELRLPLPPERHLALTALADLAGVAAVAVEQPETVEPDPLEVASDVLPAGAIADTIGRAADAPCRYVEGPIAAFRAHDPILTEVLLWFRRAGPTVDRAALRRALPAVAWRTLEEWASHQDWRRLLGAQATAHAGAERQAG